MLRLMWVTEVGKASRRRWTEQSSHAGIHTRDSCCLALKACRVCRDFSLGSSEEGSCCQLASFLPVSGANFSSKPKPPLGEAPVGPAGEREVGQPSTLYGMRPGYMIGYNRVKVFRLPASCA